MNKICLHCFVSGRVQGVFFRAFVEKEAKTQQITGWVRNLPDGRVEALLCGERAAVDKIAARLWEGPDRSQVTEVETKEVPLETHWDFVIR